MCNGLKLLLLFLVFGVHMSTISTISSLLVEDFSFILSMSHQQEYLKLQTDILRHIAAGPNPRLKSCVY